MGLSVETWLLTEAVRVREEQHGRMADDAAANAVARAMRGEFAERLAARAAALPDADSAREDIRRLRRFATLLTAALLAAGALAGWVAAQAALAARQVDALLALVALLGVPTVMLLLWLVLVITRPGGRHPGAVVSGVFGTFLDWFAPRILRSSLAPQLLRSCFRLSLTRLGRSLLVSISHGFWLAYATAAVIAMALYFSLVQYTLTWGTTILDRDAVVMVIGALAWLPSALNLMPDANPDWVLAAREGTGNETGRAAWAQFLMASVALYGALPRLLLVALCGAMAWYQARRLQLNSSLPGYLRLCDILGADSHPGVDDEAAVSSLPRVRHNRAVNAAGAALLMTVERPGDDGAAGLPGIDAQFVGTVDSRAARRQLEAALGALNRPPPALIAVCSLLRTPDRGTAAVLGHMANVADAPLLLVLDDGSRLAERGGHPGLRETDWRRLADSIGAMCVVLDRRDPDPAAMADIRRWLGAEANSR